METDKCIPFQPGKKYMNLCKSEALYTSCRDTYSKFNSIKESFLEYLRQIKFYMNWVNSNDNYKSSNTYQAEYNTLKSLVEVIERKRQYAPSFNKLYIADNFNQIYKEEIINGKKEEYLSFGRGVSNEVHFRALSYMVKQGWLLSYNINKETIYTIPRGLNNNKLKEVCTILGHSINYALLTHQKLPFKMSLSLLVAFFINLSSIKKTTIKAKLLKYFVNYDPKHMFCKYDIKTLKEYLACDGNAQDVAVCFQNYGMEMALPCAIDFQGKVDMSILKTIYDCGYQLRYNILDYGFREGDVDKLIPIIYELISPPILTRFVINDFLKNVVYEVNDKEKSRNLLPLQAKYILKCFELLLTDFDGNLISDFRHEINTDLSLGYRAFIEKLLIFWTSSPVPSERCIIGFNDTTEEDEAVIIAHTCSKQLEFPMSLGLKGEDAIQSDIRTLYTSLVYVVDNPFNETTNMV